MGEKPSGTPYSLTGSSALAVMLNRQSKPSGDRMPTSPILMPHFLYVSGSVSDGSGFHNGWPCFFESSSRAYVSLAASEVLQPGMYLRAEVKIFGKFPTFGRDRRRRRRKRPLPHFCLTSCVRCKHVEQATAVQNVVPECLDQGWVVRALQLIKVTAQRSQRSWGSSQ